MLGCAFFLNTFRCTNNLFLRDQDHLNQEGLFPFVLIMKMNLGLQVVLSYFTILIAEGLNNCFWIDTNRDQLSMDQAKCQLKHGPYSFVYI